MLHEDAKKHVTKEFWNSLRKTFKEQYTPIMMTFNDNLPAVSTITADTDRLRGVVFLPMLLKSLNFEPKKTSSNVAGGKRKPNFLSEGDAEVKESPEAMDVDYADA